MRPAPSSSQPCFALTLWRLRRYPQAALAATGDAVAVSINYRVNGFGFMALPELGKVDPRGVSGNYGFLDQQLGLKVRTATLGCQRVATTAWLCAAADMGHAWVRWLGMPVGRGQHRSVWRRSRPRDSVGPVLGRNVCARAPGVAGIAGPVPPRHVSEWQSQHHRGPGVRCTAERALHPLSRLWRRCELDGVPAGTDHRRGVLEACTRQCCACHEPQPAPLLLGASQVFDALPDDVWGGVAQYGQGGLPSAPGGEHYPAYAVIDGVTLVAPVDVAMKQGLVDVPLMV